MKIRKDKENSDQENGKGEIKKIWKGRKRHRLEGKKENCIEQQSHATKGGQSAGTATEGWIKGTSYTFMNFEAIMKCSRCSKHK